MRYFFLENSFYVFGIVNSSLFLVLFFNVVKFEKTIFFGLKVYYMTCLYYDEDSEEEDDDEDSNSNEDGDSNSDEDEDSNSNSDEDEGLE